MERKASTRWAMCAAALAAALAMAFALAVQPAQAFADESSSAAASSDAASSASSPSSDDAAAVVGQALMGGLPRMGHDYVWFGNNLALKDALIANDLIAAGRTVDIKGVETEGSMRIAAQTIEISDSTAIENITIAGETVILRSTNGNSVALAGNGVSYAGSCQDLTIYASKVYIDGVVEGDVVVGASAVEIGPDARIAGTLHVSAPDEPVVKQGAEVGKLDYKKTESGRGDMASIPSTEAITSLVASLAIVFIILGIVSTFLIAVLAEWLFKGHTAAAAGMIRERTGAFIGTGIVGALVAPIAIIILCCFVITLPVAGALALALVAMTIVAGGFFGASVFKLAFPNMGRFKCAMLGGVIVAVASAIPFLGSLVGAAAFMYFLGYVLQSIFLNIRKKAPAGGAPTSPAPAYAAPPAPAAPVAPVSTAPMAPVSTAPIAPASATPANPEPLAPMSTEPIAPAPETTEPTDETA